MDKEKKAPIGLIAAMPSESDALLRLVGPWQRVALESLRGYSLKISGQECVLVTSGMGIRRAHEATRRLVNLISPRLIISFGIAGAVEAVLEIGDVVLSNAFIELNQGVIGPAMPLAAWPTGAQEAAEKVLATRRAHLFTGTAITTVGSQVSADRLGGIAHPVLEMETAGIAGVTLDRGIPLLSLRAISDGPRAPIPIDLGEVMDENANLIPGKLLKAIFRNPRILVQSRRMLRNSRLAADHAAIALLAALSSTNF
jgi:adenosylhomocysteine nucleosidase